MYMSRYFTIFFLSFFPFISKEYPDEWLDGRFISVAKDMMNCLHGLVLISKGLLVCIADFTVVR